VAGSTIQYHVTSCLAYSAHLGVTIDVASRRNDDLDREAGRPLEGSLTQERYAILVEVDEIGLNDRDRSGRR
jgi:hypothetical protein